jgi:hypothetical protein
LLVVAVVEWHLAQVVVAAQVVCVLLLLRQVAVDR